MLQAIAELCEISKQLDAARHWQERALAGYLQSAQRGEVHYYHHLTDYYADVAKDGAAAVTWARADLQLRENFATQSALAWALYRNAEFAEAAVHVRVRGELPDAHDRARLHAAEWTNFLSGTLPLYQNMRTRRCLNG